MQISTKKFTIYLIISIILSLGLSLSFQSLLAAWTAPAANPPGANTYAPIYATSSAAQMISKEGGTGGSLGVEGKFSVGDDSYFAGNVGIGTASPAEKLDVDGNINVRGLKIKIGNSGNYFYGDASNLAARMDGDFYAQNQAGDSYKNIYANDYYINASGKWASQIGVGCDNTCALYVEHGSYYACAKINSTQCRILDYNVYGIKTISKYADYGSSYEDEDSSYPAVYICSISGWIFAGYYDYGD